MAYTKRCFVPNCQNDSLCCPNKLFAIIPPSKKLDWFNSVRRSLPIKSTVYFCCEDHFDIKKDCKMFWRSRQLMRMKDDALPKRFSKSGDWNVVEELRCAEQLDEETASAESSEVAEDSVIEEPLDIEKASAIDVDLSIGSHQEEVGEEIKLKQKVLYSQPMIGLQASSSNVLQRPKRSTPFTKLWAKSKLSSKKISIDNDFNTKPLDLDNCCKIPSDKVNHIDSPVEKSEGRPKRSTPFRKLWITEDYIEPETPMIRRGECIRLTKSKPDKNKNKPDSGNNIDATMESYRFPSVHGAANESCTYSEEKLSIHELALTSGRCRRSTPFKKLWIGEVKLNSRRGRPSKCPEPDETDPKPMKRKRGRPRKAMRSHSSKDGVYGSRTRLSGITSENQNREIKTEPVSPVEVKSEPMRDNESFPEIKTELPDDPTVVKLVESPTKNFSFVGSLNLSSKEGLRLIYHDATHAVESNMELSNDEFYSSTISDGPIIKEEIDEGEVANHIPIDQTDYSYVEHNSELESDIVENDENHSLSSCRNNLPSYQDLPSLPTLQPMFSVPVENNDRVASVAETDGHQVESNMTEMRDLPEDEIGILELGTMLNQLIHDPWSVETSQNGFRIMKHKSDSISMYMEVSCSGTISVIVHGEELPQSHPLLMDMEKYVVSTGRIRLNHVLELIHQLLNSKICCGIRQNFISKRSEKCTRLGHFTTRQCSACTELSLFPPENNSEKVDDLPIIASKFKTTTSSTANAVPLLDTVESDMTVANSSGSCTVPVPDVVRVNGYVSDSSLKQNELSLDKDEAFKLMGLRRTDDTSINIRKSMRRRKSTKRDDEVIHFEENKIMTSTEKEFRLKHEKDFISKNFETIVNLFSRRLFWGPYTSMQRSNLLKAFCEINKILKIWSGLVDEGPKFYEDKIPEAKGEEELNQMKDEELRNVLNWTVTELIEIKRRFRKTFPTFRKLYRPREEIRIKLQNRKKCEKGFKCR